MPWKYNPFTDALDQTGSGGASYIDGVVADPTALPVTLGTPALDSVYLAKAGSGVWLINRRPAGLYCRTANNGVAADWTYLGAFPEVNSSANWELYDGTDPTKELKFDLSGITTGATRTLTVPDASGRIQVEGQPIGNTTPSSGAFTTLTANNGTIAASAPALNIEQTWNNPATTFIGATINANVTAAATASRVFRVQIDGTDRFWVGRWGEVQSSAGFATGGSVQSTFGIISLAGQAQLQAGGSNIIEQRTTSVAAQEYRIYGQYTSASNFERLSLKYNSTATAFQIGTEKGSGGGLARALEFQTDGVTRMTLQANGFAAVFTGRIQSGVVQCPNIGTVGDGNAGWVFGNPLSVGQSITSINLAVFARFGGHGGTTNLFPALKRSSTTLQVRLANDSDFAPFECAGLTLNGNLTASTRDIVTDTTTGTKIGTATDQKIGFWNATPAAQPAAVADATDAASTQARLNDLLARLRTIGIIAT